MDVKLSPDTSRELRLYIDGQVSNAELDEWLTQAEYDDDLPQDERDTLASIRLALIEVAEGTLNPSAILESVAAVLAASDPSQPILAFRSDSSTDWGVRSSFTDAPTRLQRVDI